MSYRKFGLWLILIGLTAGVMGLQSALAAEESDPETRILRAMEQSQSQLEAAQIAFDEIQSTRDRIQAELDGAEDSERIAELETILAAVDTQLVQAGNALEAAQAAQETVMDFANQARSSPSEDEGQAALALAEAAASNVDVFSESVRTTLEAVLQYETGEMLTGEALAAQASALEQTGQAAQESLAGLVELFEQNAYAEVMPGTSDLIASNQAAVANPEDLVVAGGPGDTDAPGGGIEQESSPETNEFLQDQAVASPAG
ncbi:MAG: hypothetical protein K9J81_01105 [Desulfohalobiaceae bacterium]|nr:hypothetical protein [Desulfohalobiaceae bacterium]